MKQEHHKPFFCIYVHDGAVDWKNVPVQSRICLRGKTKADALKRGEALLAKSSDMTAVTITLCLKQFAKDKVGTFGDLTLWKEAEIPIAILVRRPPADDGGNHSNLVTDDHEADVVLGQLQEQAKAAQQIADQNPSNMDFAQQARNAREFADAFKMCIVTRDGIPSDEKGRC